MMNQSRKDTLINMLSQALNVCQNVEYGNDDVHDPDKSPYYAVGYSRTAIQGALDILTSDL
jgi:hypothetical protein